MIHSSQITDTVYGSVSSDLKRILEVTDDLEFFTESLANQEAVTERCKEYLHSIAPYDSGAAFDFRLETGDWEKLSEIAATTSAWNDPLVEVLQKRLESAISEAEWEALLKPPLWPVAGLRNVVEVVVADRERVLRNVPEPFSEIGWNLGCGVEDLAWSALRWCLKKDDVGNPYLFLLRLAASGVYLIGVDGQKWVFFSFGSSKRV